MQTQETADASSQKKSSGVIQRQAASREDMG